MVKVMEHGFNKNAKYCVASLGRCGSTMMTLYLIKKFDVATVTGVHTRDYVEFNGKTVFLFGNPYNTVLSTHTQMKKRPLRVHYIHMGGEYKRRFDFWNYDSLHIENLFDDWYQPHQFEMVSLRYETLWDNLDKLGDYLGIDIDDFPQKIERKTDWTKLEPRLQSVLKRTYGRLNRKIESAEDFKIWKPLSVPTP